MQSDRIYTLKKASALSSKIRLHYRPRNRQLIPGPGIVTMYDISMREGSKALVARIQEWPCLYACPFYP